MNFFRRPLIAAALADQVEEHAEGELGVLPPLDDLRRGDLVFEPGETVRVATEAHRRTFLLVAKQADEAFERRAEGRRRQGGVTPHAEVTRPELVAEPEPEILIAGLLRRLLEEAAESAQLQFLRG